jgi:hypothetical protein
MSIYGNLQTRDCIGPQCSLTVYNPNLPAKKADIDAILDSGAAKTCLPKAAIQELGNLVKGDPILLRDANGNRLERDTYYVTIVMLSHAPIKIEVISIPGRTYALIGRDILNEHKVMLNANLRRWVLNCGQLCENIS